MAKMAGELALPFLFGFLVCFSSSSVAADSLSESLEQRIQALENQGLAQRHLLQQQQNDVNALKKENNEYKLRFRQQKILLNAYIRRVSTLETRVANMEHYGNNGIVVDEKFVQEPNSGGNASALGDNKERQPTVDVKDKTRTHISKERIRSSTQHVAFHASFQGNGMDPIGLHQKVVFSDVLLNLGNGYHHNLGAFIAPKAGIYMFSTSIAVHDPIWTEVAIMKNGKSLSHAIAESQQYQSDQGSVTVVTSLNVGDELWISCERSTTMIFGFGLSSFTGCLLFEI